MYWPSAWRPFVDPRLLHQSDGRTTPGLADISSSIIGWGFPPAVNPYPSHQRHKIRYTSGRRYRLSRLYSRLDDASEDQNRSVHAWGINNTSLGGGLREAVPVAAKPERIREYEPGRFHPLRPSDAVIRPVEVNGTNEKKSSVKIELRKEFVAT